MRCVIYRTGNASVEGTYCVCREGCFELLIIFKLGNNKAGFWIVGATMRHILVSFKGIQVQPWVAVCAACRLHIVCVTNLIVSDNNLFAVELQLALCMKWTINPRIMIFKWCGFF